MHPGHPIVPYGLMAFGVIYIFKPDIFYMWIARRGPDQAMLDMPDRDRKFMRALGLVFVMGGLAILVQAAW